MNRLNVITILILLLTACDNSPKFEYQSPTPKQASENLGAYLRQAPFENEWNQQGEDENTVVFTNAEQVFPFMAKFKNEDDDLKSQKYGKVKDFYDQQTVIYKDDFWGELFVYGGLLFNQEPLFLKNFFSEMGNPIFSGANAINQSYTASLAETQLVEQLPDSKTAVYWVSSNIKNYLLLYHQKGQLVLEVAYPCYDDVKDKGLAKLKEINTSMNINSKMLANATVEGLSVNQKPVSFWKDPYKGIYSTGIVPVLRLKIKNTPFENGTIGEARAKGGDDYYFYKGDKGQVWFTTKLEDTELTSEAYFSEDKSPVFYEYKYLSETRKVYITQKEENGNVIGKAETYYRDNRTLHFEYEYPVGDTQAEKYLKDMFEHIRISAFL